MPHIEFEPTALGHRQFRWTATTNANPSQDISFCTLYGDFKQGHVYLLLDNRTGDQTAAADRWYFDQVGICTTDGEVEVVQWQGNEGACTSSAVEGTALEL